MRLLDREEQARDEGRLRRGGLGVVQHRADRQDQSRPVERLDDDEKPRDDARLFLPIYVVGSEPFARRVG